MTTLTWDQVGERKFETGVDRGVLYIPDSGGAYNEGVSWNGLTAVNETPSGAEANAQYADNIKYLNLYSAEEFGCTIEAFTYPDEFAQFNGEATPTPGVTIGQQNRKVFGFAYRTLIGNDVDGNDAGYKLHLVYGCQASPSEKNYATVNDTPEAMTLSWEVSTSPVAVPGYKPSATLVVDSTVVDADALSDLEDILWGTPGDDPRLPQPAEVVALFSGSITVANPTKPTNVGNAITIPTVTGVTYYIDGEPVAAGVVNITEDTMVEARPNPGYVFPPVVDTDWLYVYS